MEHCSARVAFQIYCAFVRADDLLANCQAKAGSTGISGNKRLKDIFLDIIRDHGSGICHDYVILRWYQVICCAYHTDIQSAACFFHRLHCVTDQINKNLFKRAIIRFYPKLYLIFKRVRRGAQRSRMLGSISARSTGRKWYSTGFEKVSVESIK